MALLYPWATKEYLLHQMTFGQIILYYNLGIELKYGKQEKSVSAKDMSYEQLAKLKEDLKKQYGDIDESR